MKHVWASLIGEWLRRARKADAEGRADIHLQRVSITFEENDEQTDGLLNWIENQIASVRAPYATTKTNIFDTIGFDQSRGIATVTFKLEGTDDLLDLQLGLKRHFETSRLVYRSERFGISAGQPELDLRDVRVSLTPEGREVLLRATFTRGMSVALKAKFYGAKNEESYAWRVATQCLDISHGPNGCIRAKAHLRAGDAASIDELALFAHLQASPPGAEVFLEVDINGRWFDLGSVTMEGQDQSGGWPWLGLSLETVRQLAATAGKPVPPMPLASFNKAAWELEVLCALASERRMLLDFTPEPGTPRKFAAMLGYCWAEVGDTVFGVVARRAIVVDRKEKKRRKIEFGAARILQGFIAQLSDWAPETIERAYARHLEIMAAEGDILALGDLRTVVRRQPGDQLLKSDLPTRRLIRNGPHKP